MTAPFFFIRAIEQQLTLYGYKIVLTSDVPSHLWMRWTLVEPQEHDVPIFRRGIAFCIDKYYCFVVYCDVKQLEDSDTLIHTFLLPGQTSPTTPPTGDWPFYEPWGTYLTQYNPWTVFSKDSQPVITFAGGVIKIADTGRLDVGIAYYPPPAKLPLLSENNEPLTINIDCPDATAVDPDTKVHFEVWLTNGIEDFNMYLYIARGTNWDWMGDYGVSPPPPVYHCWLYPGLGEHTIDLLELFQKARIDLGLSSNPTNWRVSRTGFALGVYPPAVTEYVKCDHVGFYYPIRDACNEIPWPECQTRWFYFHGSVGGVASKSTSPIFKKHRKLPPLGAPVWIECPQYGNAAVWTAEDLSWLTVQTKNPYDADYHPICYIATTHYAGKHYLQRSAFAYDTTAIPLTSIIVDAHFRWYGRFNPWVSTPYFDHWEYVLDFLSWDLSDAASWYAYINSLTQILAEIYVLTTWNDAWRNHPLTPLGLAAIVKGGITKYAWSTRHDVLNIDPGMTTRGYQQRQPIGYDPPTLFVQYRPLL